ncbi:MAG: glyoxylate/hydroxypyruvate reductase A [Geminicoccaceae bacterium]|nr:glyoxylate/hydroxypyruvate reductase A [Geminicoccaceae bacterium]MCX7629551.1 glyoxylate/hydroxypyruvate reductase A [Geminicoccaceae bacterium]MDW8125540.1 glyoxylate/hydroxypyruvate reductase A [Geminicoccaceae bacterium]
MVLLFASPDDDPVAWTRALRRRLPELEIRVYPDLGDPEAIEAALVWSPPPGLLAALPRLRVILSLGAGVDRLLEDPTLPPEVPICRMVDPSLTRSMAEFVLLHVLRYHRFLDVYEEQQRRAQWRLLLPRPPEATVVGIMGLGELGTAAANLLRGHGFSVKGWSRTRKTLEGVKTYAGRDELDAFLADLSILVCLLPLTPETRGILDRGLFARLPEGARLVNLARGGHLVEEDLLEALESGRLAHATLDVFAREPLPADHPFWRHPKITVTPHAAAYSLPESGAEVVAENLRRLRAGRPLLHLVDRARGY